MSTVTVVPEVQPSAATAEPAAPAPAPSIPSSPSPATGTKPQIQDFDSPEDFLDSAIKNVKEKTAAAKPEQEAAEQEEAEAPPRTVENETEEEGAEEKAAEEQKSETETAGELEDGEILSPKDFAKQLNADPAAKAFFDKNPEMRNRVFAALRRDSENREMRQLFPDVESAQEAAETAATYGDLDQKFLGATTPEGAQSFLQSWYEMALVRDGQGRPLPDGRGGYQVEPAWNAVNQHIFDTQLKFLGDKAGNEGNSELSAALDIIREVIAGPSRPKDDELPAHVKAAAERVKADREALDRREREQQEAVSQDSLNRVAEKTTEKTDALLTPAFQTAGLTEFEKEAANDKIETLLIGKLKANPLYLSQRNRILSQRPGDGREQALVAHDMKYIHQYLGPLAAQVIHQAKAGTLQRQDEKQTKINRQIAASQSEPRGASSGAAPQKAVDPKAQKAQIQKEYADAHGGEPMPPEELIAEVMKRSKATLKAQGRV